MSRALDARNRLGVVRRHHPDDHAAITDARRALAAAKLEDYVERVVAEAPPLTVEQRDKIALLLRGSAADPRTAA